MQKTMWETMWEIKTQLFDSIVAEKYWAVICLQILIIGLSCPVRVVMFDDFVRFELV